ncbi:TIGR03960 family B12-binding radical SAM protein, partial [Desulfobacterales bacterium HSG2]|nr:TIGR03960 family B12-binding radical SAM protein [Desulfobacterales bacterium HSG2]
MKNFQDILSLVEQPSRYLGSEINRVKKDHAAVSLRVALAFPDLYEIGTSHFGIQILYYILNSHKDILAERVFAPAADMEACLRASDIPLLSQESHKPLDTFDIIGFSLLYELNFTNILTILDLAGIPFFASQRESAHPLIIAGGPCTCNPEPVADFFDAIVIGDGETVIMEMARTYLQLTTDDQRLTNKEALLKLWSGIEGVYIPAFFEPAYIQSCDGPGFQILSAKYPDYIKVTRTIVNDLDTAVFPDTPIVPYGKPVHDRLRIEISRGCTRGCRFCQAGMIYRPVRERSLGKLLDLTEASLTTTGYEDLSLLSLSTGDYGSIVPLMEHLMGRCASERVAVSFPSLRAGTLTPELMTLIRQVRKTGFTIAPEAGSQRLRDVINKNITETDITDTVKDAFSLGWQVVKLYFMIGLPFETDEDLEAIAELVKHLRKIRGPKGRKGKINVSVGTFIPKPHTPFQWASQIPLDESKDKIHWVQDRLRMPGIQFKWQNPEVSRLEGLWARGDRRLSALLVAAYRKGCKFDGWSDKFQFDLWQEAFSDEGVDVDFYTTRARDMEEPLPWDHIDIGVTKDFLKEEWENAVSQKHTPDCR